MKMDYSNFTNPLVKKMESLTRLKMDPTVTIDQYLNMRKNTYETFDDPYLSFSSDQNGDFYQVGRIQKVDQVREKKPHEVFKEYLFIEPYQNQHFREVFSILQLLEEMGGIIEIISVISFIFLYPVNEFNFFIKAIKELYLINTKDE
jgi:hypothetical protein